MLAEMLGTHPSKPHPIWVALLLLLPLAGCQRPDSSRPSAGAEAAPDFAIEVETARARRGAIVQRVSAPGSLVARRESRIGAEVSGRIEKIHVAEGDRVEAGDTLFEIDHDAYEMGLRQAKAGLDLAVAERQQLESDLRRAETLAKQNVLAKQDIERLTTSLAVSQARERQATQAVALAQHNLERTVIRAPYTASIAARLVDEGTTALVQPQTIVVVLQETEELEARATIPESQLTLIRSGDRALVHVEGVPEPIETEISAVSDTIDAATRTYLVKARVANPDHRLKAGIFSHVEILPEAKSDVLLVPSDAVRREDGLTRVLVVRDGRAESVPVEVGIVSEEEAEILQGLQAGDEVVIGDAARTIAPGMPVRVAGDGAEPSG